MTQYKRDVGNKSSQKEPSQIPAEVGGVGKSLRDEKAHDGRGQPSDQAQQPCFRDEREQKGGTVVHNHRGNGDQFELIGVQPASCAGKRFHFLYAPFACGGDYREKQLRPARDACTIEIIGQK